MIDRYCVDWAVSWMGGDFAFRRVVAFATRAEAVAKAVELCQFHEAFDVIVRERRPDGTSIVVALQEGAL